MVTGGTQTPQNNQTYNMKIYQSELSTLYCSNLIFDSSNDSIYVSSFIQSTHMNGVSNGYIKIRSSTSNGTYQYIEFAENIVECSQNTNGINIIGYNGIYIDKNITNYNGILTFNFIENNLKFGSSSVYKLYVIMVYMVILYL